jgi:hypothetical protein
MKIFILFFIFLSQQLFAQDTLEDICAPKKSLALDLRVKKDVFDDNRDIVYDNERNIILVSDRIWPKKMLPMGSPARRIGAYLDKRGRLTISTRLEGSEHRNRRLFNLVTVKYQRKQGKVCDFKLHKGDDGWILRVYHNNGTVKDYIYTNKYLLNRL